MPSVRVKRGQYSYLFDGQQDDSTAQRRPRSRSIASILGQNPTSPQGAPTQEAPPSPLTELQHGRQRSRTIDTAVSDAPTPGRPQRPPSRISDHIMSSARTPQRTGMSSAEVRTRASDSPRLTAEKRDRSSQDGGDTVSLQGSTENIVYHGSGRPGRIGSALSLPTSQRSSYDLNDEHHHDDIVEHLDVIDPQVATVSTLTNAANAMVFPPLSWYSRKPTIVLRDIPDRASAAGDAERGQTHEDNLDRHVEDVLSKRDRYRRIMRGVWAFMKTPMGVIVSIYGFLVVFWGTGIVLFLAKFINVHNDNTQGYWVELCQQVETGLFTATSIGLIPFRVLDTWRISKIWHYQRLTIKRRAKAGLPDLYDNNDLPDPLYDLNYVHVLTEKEQADLHYQQHKFMQSQTWYRPHGTFTHRAFPIPLAGWITILNDLNSFFQVLLSGCMWSLNRFQRPAWTTATTLPACFVAGIAAGVYIWWGGKKTRRHEQVEERLRAALAMERPRINVTAPQQSDENLGGGHESRNEDIGLQETSTANSTPTIASQGPPRCRDFMEKYDGEGNGTGERETLRDLKEEEEPLENEKPRVRHLESNASWNSVPIAESMTVPAAADIHPGSASQ